MSDHRIEDYAGRLLSWSDANPYKPKLAASLSALGGKHRPTTAAEDRIIMAEEEQVAAARTALRQRESA